MRQMRTSTKEMVGVSTKKGPVLSEGKAKQNRSFLARKWIFVKSFCIFWFRCICSPFRKLFLRREFHKLDSGSGSDDSDTEANFRGNEEHKGANMVLEIEKNPNPNRPTVKRKPEKRALIVGISYPKNSPAYLRGAVNDARSMHRLLTDKYGFKNVKTITDTSDSPVLPTARNIFDMLFELCNTAQPGDVVLFHFSGHGMQVDSLTMSEVDGLDECLVGVDFNLIRDNDLRYVVSLLPPSVNFTFIADCCHSGTMLDLDTYNAITEQTIPDSPKTNPPEVADPTVKERSLGLEFIQKHGLRLLERFTETADSGKHASNSSGPNRGILFSACRDDQRSLDLYVREFECYHGVLTSALLSTLKKKKSITHEELLSKVNESYKVRGVRLNALLNCLPEFKSTIFLEQI